MEVGDHLMKELEFSEDLQNFLDWKCTMIKQQKFASTIFKEYELLLDPGIFGILAVRFSTNIELINEINHEDRLIERKKILNVYVKKQHHSCGKNNINGTLIV